jgi:hypothetical protein
MRVGGPLQRERRADFDAQIAGMEVPGCLFENRSLTFSVLAPPEDRCRQ